MNDPDDDTEAVGLGCALKSFVEHEEVADLVQRLPCLVKSASELESAKQRLITLLDRYQEQPHLLDPYLPGILDGLVKVVLTVSEGNCIDGACAFAAHITKVRGYKVVVRHLPHEVFHVEPVLCLLEQQRASAGAENWETQYFLLLWMSILVLIPFHMDRFDGDSEKGSLMQRIQAMCEWYIVSTNKCQDAASFLAGKFFTRPEVASQRMNGFLAWCLKSVTSSSNSSDISLVPAQIGSLKALASIYKYGKTEDLLKEAPMVLKKCLEANLQDHPNLLVQKLCVKVVQRIGLLFLPTKIAPWRYQRGNRSLAINLLPEGAASQPQQHKIEEYNKEETDYEVPDEEEEVIDYLLNALRSPKTIVRWSSAKGIGRVTSRLPKGLADEVVNSLLELFSLRETDGAWHGGCLALAELARRGLLLPQRIPEVVSVVQRALVYDERRGCYSVGAHIRDAACYVCWAMARAYEPEIIRPHVEKIAASLLIVTTFDREVNCRRAASAAFQENVGRLGNFPHGIDIVTRADYHAVGSRTFTFLELSVFIASFPEYKQHMIHHLLDRKVGHWDLSVRELAACSLNRLTAVDAEFMATVVLPKLVSNVSKGEEDLYLMHGSICAIGEVVLGLATQATQRGTTLSHFIGEELMSSIKDMALDFEKKMVLRGGSGEMLRSAVSLYILRLSQAAFPCHQDHNVVDVWKVILEDNLSFADSGVQEKTVEAVAAFLTTYLCGSDSREKQSALVSHYISLLDASEQHRKGFALALGNMPFSIVNADLDHILPALISRTKVAASTDKWAEGRRDTVKAIIQLVKTLGVSKGLRDNVEAIYQCYLDCLDDYTVDRRGDIGAWVREAAISGLHHLTTHLLRHDPAMIPAHLVAPMMSRLAQQAVEKIDRTRGHAASTFAALVSADGPCVPSIPYREEVQRLFGAILQESPDAFGWAVESQTFPIFCQLLRFDAYRERVLLGLVVSVGGLTERLVKYSSEALFEQLRFMSPAELEQFGQALLSTFREKLHVERVTLPMLKFIDRLLSTGSIGSLCEDADNPFSFELFGLVKQELTRTSDPNKLMSGVDVLCALLQANDRRTVSKCLIQLAIFLCHRYPRIRRITAAKLFEALITFADKDIVREQHLEQVSAILCDTCWDQSVHLIRPIRNELCQLLDIPAPASVTKLIAP